MDNQSKDSSYFNIMRIIESYRHLLSYIQKSEFRGYDPYDGASSEVKLIRENYIFRLVSTYLNKFSPINLRALLLIKPSCQNQALGFIGRVLLSDYDNNKELVDQITNTLISSSLKKLWGYHCWDSHGFPIQMRGSYRPVGMTDIVGNEAIGRFFLALYKIRPSPLYGDICISVRDFFFREFLVGYKNYRFYKYKPITPQSHWCYNASAIAAAYIEAVSREVEESFDSSINEKIMSDIVFRQKADGEWHYSYDIDSGFEKPQIDFHQGFILDALLEFMEINGYEEPYLTSYKKGLEFYCKNQFLRNGKSIYRYPKKWPVNIHNQAQGIITFSRAAKAGFGEQYLDFARTIAEWTIKNMQDEDGHFYYLKYPLFTNKIPYIRWSDTAMAYALAVFLEIRDQGLETRNGKS